MRPDFVAAPRHSLITSQARACDMSRCSFRFLLVSRSKTVKGLVVECNASIGVVQRRSYCRLDGPRGNSDPPSDAETERL